MRGDQAERVCFYCSVSACYLLFVLLLPVRVYCLCEPQWGTQKIPRGMVASEFALTSVIDIGTPRAAAF
jgi:hypothetical protein